MERIEPLLDVYTDYELLHSRPDLGVSVYRARAVAGPTERVICKCMAKSNPDDNIESFMNEYLLVNLINETLSKNQSVKSNFEVIQKPGQRRQSFRLRPGHSPFSNPSLSSHANTLVPRVIAFEDLEDRAILVFEDFGGDSLRTFVQKHGRLSIQQILQVASEVAEALTVIHRSKIIHLDVNPDNVLVKEREDGSLAVQIIDFDLAALCSPDKSLPNQHSHHIHGTPAYMSPEQTGRIQKIVDYRSDLYSIGITLWELVAGRCPFGQTDLADLVYSHMARELPNVRLENPLIPRQLAMIIEKLTKKNPEDRYQTSKGLLVDLNSLLMHCKLQFDSNAVIADQELKRCLDLFDFECGLKDFSPKLRLDGKVFGRENEISCFMNNFHLVKNCEMNTAAVCIRGSAGSGKSALISALERDVVRQDGTFLRGKIIDSKDHTPLGAILSILDTMTRFLLTEPRDVLDSWNKKLKERISDEMMPTLCKLIPLLKSAVNFTGEEEEVDPNLRSRELFQALENLFGTFVNPGKVLVVYLGELMDDKTGLAFLNYLLTTQSVRSLLFLGTDKLLELTSASKIYQGPLSTEYLSQICFIELGPISRECIMILLQSAIRPPGKDLTELADLLFKKTSGNPFHIIEILKFCESHGLLKFDEEDCHWTWNIEDIDRKTELTENVVDILSQSIKMLPVETQNALNYAACIGKVFELRFLTKITKLNIPDLESILRPSIQNGLIFECSDDLQGNIARKASLTSPFSSSQSQPSTISFRRQTRTSPHLKFSHVKLQEAVYSAIEPKTLSSIHLKIAQTLREEANDDPSLPPTLGYLGHYNLGLDSLVDFDEKWFVIKLNQSAASSSSTLGEYASHLKNVEYILESLDKEEAWKTRYQDMLSVMNELFRFEIEDRQVQKAIAIQENCKVHIRESGHNFIAFQEITMLLAKRQIQQGLELGLNSLKKCKSIIAEQLSPYNMDFEIEQLRSELCQRIESTSKMGESNFNIAFQPKKPEEDLEYLYTITAMAARMVKSQKLSLFLTLQSSVLSMRATLSDVAVMNLASCIPVYIGAHGPIDCLNYKRLVFTVHEGMRTMTRRSRALAHVGSHFCFEILNKDDVEDSAIFYRTIRSIFTEYSYLVHGAETFVFEIGHMVSTGKPFNDIKSMFESNAHSYSPLVELMNDLTQCFQTIKSIIDGPPNLGEIPEESSATIAKTILQYCSLLVAAIYKKPNALELYNQMSKSMFMIVGTWIHVDIYVIGVIVMAEKHRNCSSAEEKAALEVDMEANLEMIETIFSVTPADWASPHRFKQYLAEAEFKHCTGDMVAAVKVYEDASEGAKLSQMVLFDAWASELQGRFWASQHSKKLARNCILGSIQMWSQWGSDKMVANLKLEYVDTLIAPMARRNTNRKARPVSLVLGRNNSFDDMPESATYQSPISAFPKSTTQSSFPSTSGAASSRMMAELDVGTVLKVVASLTNEKTLDNVLTQILTHLVQNAGATKAILFLNEDGYLTLQAVAEDQESKIKVQITTDANVHKMPMTVINFAFHTQEALIFTDTPEEAAYRKDPYIDMFKPKSILCCPIRHQNQLTGVLYLENSMQSGAFTPSRVEFVKSLLASASVSIENTRLIKKNNELAEALRETEDTREGRAPRYNVDAPIKRVLDSVKSIKSRFAKNDPIMAKLDEILRTLTSDGLFTANLDDINDENGQSLDSDTKSWIEASLLNRNTKTSIIKPPPSTNPSEVPPSATAAISSALSLPPAGSDSIKSLTDLGTQGMVFQTSLAGSFNRDVKFLNYAEIDVLLETALTSEFDVFKFADVTGGSPLYYLGMYFLQRHGLIEHFSLNEDMIRCWFSRVESSYHHLPYHNSSHAADVLQSALLLIFTSHVADQFTMVDILSLILSAAVHDLDHPGLNNPFLIQIQHPLAILYNDISVLESHHVARAFELAKAHDSNVFFGLQPDVFRTVRKSMISTVLATDLSQHFSIINKFKGKISTGSFKIEETADRQLLVEMAVKCGDLGNPAKRFEDAKKWTFLVMEEFFRQGEKEKAMNLPVSKFYDRNDTNIPKCQIGFIDVLVTPLFDSWSMFSQSPFSKECISNLAFNRAQWQAYFEKPELLISPFSPEKHEILQFDISYQPVSFSRRPSAISALETNGNGPKLSFVAGRGSILSPLSRSNSTSQPKTRASVGSSGSIPRSVVGEKILEDEDGRKSPNHSPKTTPSSVRRASSNTASTPPKVLPLKAQPLAE